MPFSVLVVDSDKGQAEKSRTLLLDHGYEAALSTCSADASGQLESGTYDVVICDMGIDGDGGVDFLRTVSANKPEVRFVMTAVDTGLGHVLQALKAGAHDYLKKPVSDRDMLHSVDAACKDTDVMEKVDIELGEAGWVELQMPSLESTMHRLDRFFRLMYEGQVLPDTLEDLGLCFREVVKNAIEWGHRFDVKKKVRISHVLFQDQFVFKIQDNGEGYDISKILDGPEDLVQMETDREDVGKRPGGLGMTMVKGLMDQVVYNLKGNMIILSKSVLPQEDYTT
jgi:CheY-like chemotaxis protein/anti-sigma regulatory factor (Ser/Thr protein kinase)